MIDSIKFICKIDIMRGIAVFFFFNVFFATTKNRENIFDEIYETKIIKKLCMTERMEKL